MASNCFGCKYFLGTHVVETKTLKACELSAAVNAGVMQPAVVVFIFFSPAFCKKCISKCFIFQLELYVSKGLKHKILNGTISVGRFVMVCRYIHTVAGIKKCECIKRLVELIIRDYKCLHSYYLKQQLLCAKNNTLGTFVLPDVYIFVIALNNILIFQGQGRGKGHVV